MFQFSQIVEKVPFVVGLQLHNYRARQMNAGGCEFGFHEIRNEHATNEQVQEKTNLAGEAEIHDDAGVQADIT